MNIYLSGKVDERKWQLVQPFRHLCMFRASDGSDATHWPHGWNDGHIIGPACWQQCNDQKLFVEQIVLDKIRKCDALIAYLCTDNAYGSIAEIAFASAIGKPCHMIVEEHLTSEESEWGHCPLYDAYCLVGSFPGVRVHHTQNVNQSTDCLVEILETHDIRARSYAYFVEAVGRDELKIGSSADPERRLPTLQTGNGCELRLLGFMRGGQKWEFELQRKFAHLRIRRDGEWYRATDELRTYIATYAVPSRALPALI